MDDFNTGDKISRVALVTYYAGLSAILGLGAVIGNKAVLSDGQNELHGDSFTLSQDTMKIEKQCPENNGVTITTGPLYGSDGKRLPGVDAVVFCNTKVPTRK